MEETTTRVHLGWGSLSWPPAERRTDRYGAIILTHEGPSGQVLAEGAYLLPANLHDQRDRPGKLICVVRETHTSMHIGDLARGIFPSTPQVGEEIVLGEGCLWFEQLPDSPITCLGLKPQDGRAVDWLDPNQLYRVHMQTVDVYFEPIN